MGQCSGFPPSANKSSRILILGSMPGVRSLQLQQYYAHSQNRFWPLMADLFGRDAIPVSYPEKLAMLLESRVALWDVLAGCERDGSLDSAITSEQANDFMVFFTAHPEIKTIFFNGGKAAQSFKKHCRPLLADPIRTFFTLPSTSPANARWHYGRLREAWNVILKPL